MDMDQNCQSAAAGNMESGEGWMPVVLGLQPEEAPHSATRFVLPFIHNLGPASKSQPQTGPTPPPGTRYQRMDPNQKGGDWDARRDYLINETRTVLFERATWWGLGCQSVPFNTPAVDGRLLHAVVGPPVVILFEQESDEDLLRHGLLVVEVRFGQRWRLDDQLLFNELFRFWRQPYPEHRRDFGPQLESYAQAFAGLTGPVPEESYGSRWLSLLRFPLEGRGYLLDPGGATPESVFGNYADNRAFVWTRALLDDTNLKQVIPHNCKQKPDMPGEPAWQAKRNEETGYRDMFGYWVKLLNVDRPLLDWHDGAPRAYQPWPNSNQLTPFEREWAAAHTYRRWEESNCYYGFNHFSAGMLSVPCRNPPTWQHWFQMYFDQVLLLLYVRVILFRFSDELTRISKEMLARNRTSGANAMERWKTDFRHLRRAFTCFENLYQFPLLSNQQQAIEMYDLARKRMDIDDLYKEISTEIRSSDELLEAEVEATRSRYAYVLNLLAAVGLGLSVALTCYQMQTFANWWDGFTRTLPPWLAAAFPVGWMLCWVWVFLVGARMLANRLQYPNPRGHSRQRRTNLSP